MNKSIAHFYRQTRQHQLETYGNSGLHNCAGVDQRQFTGGSAAYGCHAIAAHNSAKGQVHFRNQIKRRSGK